MKKNLLYLLLLIGLTVSAKNLTVHDSDSESKSEKESNISTVNPCQLNVEIAQTLDIPTSQFFVNTVALNGTAPYTYYLDGELSPNGYVFYTSNLNKGIHTVTVQDANGCTGSGTFEVITSPLSITTIIKNPSCIESGSITCAAIGGVGPYMYTISVNGGVKVSTSLNGIFTNLIPGVYQIQVTDGIGTTSITIKELTGPTALVATAIVTKSLDCTSGATVVCGATGGSGVCVYSFDNGVNYSSTSTFTTSMAGSITVFVKDASFGCVTNTVINIEPLSPLSPTITATNITCNGLNDGTISIIAKGGTAPYKFSIDNGVTLTSNPEFNNLYAGTYNVIVKDANGCIYTETVIITEPEPLTATASVENQTITVNAAGGRGMYTYSFGIDNSAATYLANNLFSIGNNNYGYYSASVKDSNGCLFTLPNILVTPPAPLLNGEKTLDIQFILGQTLKDIIVDGQNIKWYSSKGTSNNKSQAPLPTTLPLSTLLVDNTTYYASQTINGFESTQRLAVTTKLNLSTTDYVLPNFKFYPNPVKNVLTISNTATIDEVVLISVKGETLLTKKINNSNAEIDLSHFSKGLYFLKIKAEGTEKTIKIIKE